MKKIILPVAIFASGIFMLSSCGNKTKDMNKEFSSFLTEYEAKVSNISKEAALACWDSEISGKEEDFKRFSDKNIEYSKIFSNKADFEKLKKFKESNLVTEPLLVRQLDILYNAFLSNQVDPAKLEAIIKKETEISQKFNTFRANVDGQKLTDNQIENILKFETNSKKLQAAWEGHKKIGEVVAKDIIELVKMRNEVAKSIGFDNYHQMKLKLSEQDPQEISKIFDELDVLTKDAFAKLKNEMDAYFVNRYKINKKALRPWHYQNRYFQEAPQIYEVDLDTYYAKQDLKKVTADYFKSIQLPVDDIMAKSDLYEKEGKSQHAFCIDIDKAGDVRILCNIQPNAMWMNTMLHEFGHGVYDKYFDKNLPYTLREPAHTFTTEAIAMLFGRLANNAQWMQDMVGISAEEKAKIQEIGFKSLQLQQLTFSRWAQVMYRFEKAMYENPDQDLNTLWWDLVERYQLLTRPEGRNAPDWASKMHIASSPCYYHNYLLGELLASQLNNHICTKILKADDINNQSYYNKPEVGKYLIDNVFSLGSTYSWNTMIEKATGEKLTPKYYAKQFVSSIK